MPPSDLLATNYGFRVQKSNTKPKASAGKNRASSTRKESCPWRDMKKARVAREKRDAHVAKSKRQREYGQRGYEHFPIEVEEDFTFKKEEEPFVEFEPGETKAYPVKIEKDVCRVPGRFPALKDSNKLRDFSIMSRAAKVCHEVALLDQIREEQARWSVQSQQQAPVLPGGGDSPIYIGDDADESGTEEESLNIEEEDTSWIDDDKPVEDEAAHLFDLDANVQSSHGHTSGSSTPAPATAPPAPKIASAKTILKFQIALRSIIFGLGYETIDRVIHSVNGYVSGQRAPFLRHEGVAALEGLADKGDVRVENGVVYFSEEN